MRLYQNLPEALSEIRRDLAKGPKVISTRVQQRIDQNYPGRELLFYSYAIEAGGIPQDPKEILDLGLKMGFEPFMFQDRMSDWLKEEFAVRSGGLLNTLTETLHPDLEQTIEGSWPSYTYGERLQGFFPAMVSALKDTPDSRRAFWPIFRPEDSMRAGAPTRIPCSLGYQALIRNTRDGEQLVFCYFERSADFDNFFLTDVYLASRLQHLLAEKLKIQPGQFFHQITSLHSFAVEGTEIY